MFRTTLVLKQDYAPAVEVVLTEAELDQWLKTQEPYSGVPKLRQLPHLKETYRGKNAAGGRKCRFTQARAYKSPGSHASMWYGFHGQDIPKFELEGQDNG